MKKLLLMMTLIGSVSESLPYTIYTYNGSKFKDLILSCYNHTREYYNNLDIGADSVFNGLLTIQKYSPGPYIEKNVIHPSGDSSPNNPVYCSVYVDGNDGGYELTNETPVWFDGNGNAAIAFYGEDHTGTNGTNELRTCLGTDGAMC